MTKHYKRLDLIRVFCCIAILLYHLGLLKGGYLAVCSFFALSGYLSVVSCFKKDKFSFKDYYLSRLKKIYLPLLIVVFTSITVISLFSNINWLNLKNETTSVLFGYNNYWQLNANLDYFVRHVSSPFMHLWYIAILLQFELVFPFIFVFLKKIGSKVKAVPCIILGLLSAFSFTIFMLTLNNGNTMIAYYGTIERLFSLLLGSLIGFIHVYSKPLIIKNININKIIFTIYTIILSIMFVLIDASSSLFGISMLISTIITLRLIDYSCIKSKKENKLDKPINYLSKISYLLYLVQYPVIFLFQYVELNSFIEIPFIVLITFIISCIINFALDLKKRYLLKLIVILIIFFTSAFGLFKYITSKDYTKEMKNLEEELNKNRELIEEKQKEILEKKRIEEEEWNNYLNDFNKSEEELREMVKNFYVVGIGDSVMELAVKDLYKEFPNGYFDGLTNRTGIQLNGLIKDLLDRGALGDIIILNIGTNGGWSDERNEELIRLVGDRKIFWVNATNPDYASFNPNLINFAEKHDNAYIVDWISVTKEHPEYLIRDRVHPTVYGCKIYAHTIYEAIYEVFINELNATKEAKIKEHELIEQSKISFIGNDLLTGLYDGLIKDYSSSDFIIDKEFNYESISKKLNEEIANNNLSHNVVLVFDKSSKLNEEEYNKIIELLSNYNIYIINIYDSIGINKDNVKIIDFKDDIKDNEGYLIFDKVHLSDSGNNKLKEKIEEYLKN